MEITIHQVSEKLAWRTDSDGFWVCAHEDAVPDGEFGGRFISASTDPSCVEWEAHSAEVCRQCGAYRWTDGDEEGDWQENHFSSDSFPTSINLKGGIRYGE